MLLAAKAHAPKAPTNPPTTSWFERLNLLLIFVLVAVPVFGLGNWALREVNSPRGDNEWKLTVLLLPVLGTVALCAASIMGAALQARDASATESR